MSQSTGSTDEASQSGGPTANIRLYLRASNLPQSITRQQPDTLARVTLVGAGSDLPPLPTPVPPPGEGGGDDDDASGDVLLETEVVKRSSAPTWAASFPLKYEYGSEHLFYVDIFAVRSSTGSSFSASFGSVVDKQAMRPLGRAVFDVSDVLGSPNNVKARRLRKGGVVYAHVEQQSSNDAPSRSLLAAHSDGRRFNLRLRAESLVHTHSLQSRVAPTATAKPDTYVEISRPSSSSSSSWIVVYRSPPVKESVSPAWDEAVIELSSFHSTDRDLSAFPLMITVYKVKKKKCKEIGSCQTTVAILADAWDACKTRVSVTGFSSRRLGEGEGQGEGKDECVKTFELRPTAKGGAGPSDEVTGVLSVAEASVEYVNEVPMRSQRFLNVEEEEEHTYDGSAPPMEDGESSENVNAVAPMALTHPRPKFSDYVGAGKLDIDFCVAIDFTSSNGDPRRPGTQHFSRDGMMNDYEEAIEAIGSTIEKYSSSREYPVWGFGAKYGGQVRHIFQCGNSPAAIGTQGVLDAYRTIFETDLTMSGPTEINSVLRAAAGRAKKFYSEPSSSPNYCVLLILTDGIVHNLQSTRELVRKYGEFELPLSVIVVGIGRADFTEFHEWNHAPSDVRGRFKFVEFRQHQFDPDALSREALLNVPHETVDYFLVRNILP